jgi:DNA-binding NarL/FixJ family response regulator
MSIRLVIADDHPVFRRGLRAALANMADLVVVAEVTDGATAVTAAIEHSADVVLMDLHMPGTTGIDATRQLSKAAPNIAVLVLTMFDNDESLFTAMRAGARGYLVKGADQDEIARAITTVVHGEVLFGAGIGERALAYFTAAPANARAARPFPELTDRELDVLRLVADGLNNTTIARRLFLSEKTVRNHVSNVLAKLEVTDRAQVIARAHRAGLTTPDTRP